MQIQEINTKALAQIFYNLPYELYAKDKSWIAPLDIDIQKVFSLNNRHYNENNCKRWVVFDKQKKVIGRIAAFVNPNYTNKGDNFLAGGFGFFECINDQKAANLLLNTAKQFLLSMHCVAMDGPINLGERDQFWGLLTNGFHAPLYGMNYHLPYYKKLLEEYGLQVFYEQFCFEIQLNNWQPNALNNLYERIQKNNQYEIRLFNKKKITQFVIDFVHIYNEAWTTHHGNKKITIEETLILFKQMNVLIDERLICFVYEQHKPVAFFINLPDLNFYFKHLNGKFSFWKKTQLLFNLHFQRNQKAVGLVYGVVPSHQHKGIDALLINTILTQLKQRNYSVYEMQWIGSFNPKMLKLMTKLNAVCNRTLATYRLMLNSEFTFSRHPTI